MNEILNHNIKTVTGGDGGDVLLFLGSEKTAIFDCGMAYCAPEMVENTKKELNGRPLDYVIVTHSHYDHVGGLPYLRKEWPGLISLGSGYAQKILNKPSALKVMEELAKVAWKKFKGNDSIPTILMKGMGIDKVVKENDVIDLGDKKIIVLETPGHTRCSLSFFMKPDNIIFPGETIGVLINNEIFSPILKSYADTIKSIEKCRRVKARNIISPHYGWVPSFYREKYWDMAVQSAEKSKDFIISLYKKGQNKEEILRSYTEKFWIGSTKNQQPKEAFIINAVNYIDVIIKEFGSKTI
ncbi:MBL fold metallo-hydrolase [Anaerovorax odorimutans]|uniref:MBL fold metallo-hydrolase n=1 Tax=Anaerovorax odorimutans TaxID=109327 RepID=UPI00040523D4|nr:MBL fold metallo-hydrolase [Anaerovorax odorimutans]